MKVICYLFDFRVETVSLDLLDLPDGRVIEVSTDWRDCLDVPARKENLAEMESWESQDCEDRLVHREYVSFFDQYLFSMLLFLKKLFKRLLRSKLTWKISFLNVMIL
jgi:hypothetical protein